MQNANLRLKGIYYISLCICVCVCLTEEVWEQGVWRERERDGKKDGTFGKNPGIIRLFFLPSLILSSRAWKRTWVNRETSGCLLGLECSPELCFSQSPNYVFAEVFSLLFSYHLLAGGSPESIWSARWKHRLGVLKYKNSLWKLSPWPVHSCERSRLEWPHQVTLYLLRIIFAYFWAWVWAAFENGS